MGGEALGLTFPTAGSRSSRFLTEPATAAMITVSVLPSGRNPRSHVPDAKTSEEAFDQGENCSK
jgi:hypothetical protein